MSQQPPVSTTPRHLSDAALASGFLWTLGALLGTIAVVLLAGGAWALGALAVWCLVTGWAIGRRR